jgi:hypothetical protein
MFPKKGKGFPGTGGTRGKLDYAASIATALRAELGDSHQAIKTVMRWTGATDRTAKNWVTGIRGPTGEHLISLARHSDAVFEVIIRAAGRESLLIALQLIDAREKLAAALAILDQVVTDAPAQPEPPKSQLGY